MGTNLKSIMMAPKRNIILGKWSDEKIRTKDFPLASRYPLTRRYRWQVITFEAQSRSFRALGAYHSILPEFISILAENVHPFNRVLLRKEFHKTHAGWHIHGHCGDIDKVTPGRVITVGEIRIPKADSFHRRELLINKGFVMDDRIAEAILCHNFNIPYQNDDFLVNEALPWN